MSTAARNYGMKVGETSRITRHESDVSAGNVKWEASRRKKRNQRRDKTWTRNAKELTTSVFLSSGEELYAVRQMPGIHHGDGHAPAKAVMNGAGYSVPTTATCSTSTHTEYTGTRRILPSPGSIFLF
ncbi:hypothetical protein Bbelb_013440 [Branchiostoma belcheri]|nr:hypothetical protein Bbelb_013440 [Branchiostoma belcheri]